LRKRPLPQTKYVYTPIHNEPANYSPARLDSDAVEAGVLKYAGKQHKSLSSFEFFTVLRWMKWIFGATLEGPMVTPEEALDMVNGEKAAGTPYDFMYGNKKQHSLNHMSFEDFVNDFWTYDQLHLGTLKDEMRPIGKKARFFVPVNICLVVIYNFLFGAQNNRLIDNHHDLPTKVGMSAPGYEAFQFFNKIRYYEAKGKKTVDADGQRWDALINYSLVLLVRELRKAYMPEEYHKWVDRAYDQVYAGTTLIDGFGIRLFGQLSGQTNTTSDNTLVHCALMCLHAVREGMTFSEFREDVHFNIVGDDLLYQYSDPRFSVFSLEKTWNSLGMYMESRGDVPATECTFVGMTPCQYNGLWIYKFRELKNLDSMNYTKKSSLPKQRISSLVNLTMGIFADQKYFHLLRNYTFEYAKSQWASLDEEDKTLLGMLEPQTMLKLYVGTERFGFLYFFLLNQRGGLKLMPL